MMKRKNGKIHFANSPESVFRHKPQISSAIGRESLVKFHPDTAVSSAVGGTSQNDILSNCYPQIAVSSEIGPNFFLKKDPEILFSDCAISDCLSKLISEWPANVGLKTALIWQSHSITFFQLEELSDAFAKFLFNQKNNFSHKIIAISMQNSLQLAIIIFGILKYGAAIYPVASDSDQETLQDQLESKGVFLLITDEPKKFFFDSKKTTKILVASSMRINSMQNLPDVIPVQTGRKPNAQDSALILSLKNSSVSPEIITHDSFLKKLKKNWSKFSVSIDEIGIWQSSLQKIESFLELFGTLLSCKTLFIGNSDVLVNPEIFIETLLDFPVRKIWTESNRLSEICQFCSARNRQISDLLKFVLVSSPNLSLAVAVQFFTIFPKTVLAFGQTDAVDCEAEWILFDCQRALLDAVRTGNLPQGILLQDFSTTLVDGRQNLANFGKNSEKFGKNSGNFEIYVSGKFADFADKATNSNNFLVMKKNCSIFFEDADAWKSSCVSEEKDFRKRLEILQKPNRNLTPAPILENLSEENLELVIDFLLFNNSKKKSKTKKNESNLEKSKQDELNLQNFLRKNLKTVLKEAWPREFSFFFRNHLSRICALNIAFDAWDISEKLREILNTDDLYRVASFSLFPLLVNIVENRAGVTVESYFTSVDSTLPKTVRREMLCALDEELARRASNLSYRQIITLNTDGSFRHISKIRGYRERASCQMNTLRLPDQSMPFKDRPDSARLSLHSLDLVTDP